MEIMESSSLEETNQPVRPNLWNPKAAVAWSLVLTPAFGAYLHARNWRALGKPERAKPNMIWVWATVAFLAANLGHIFMPDSAAVDKLFQLGGIMLLVAWSFSQARSQIKYVNEAFPNGYVKKGWGSPVVTGLAALGGYFAAAVFIAMMAPYDATQLATEMKPLIMQEWQKNQELGNASIQKVSLAHKEGKLYSGFVDATLDSQSTRLSLEVVADRGGIAWELKPVTGK